MQAVILAAGKGTRMLPLACKKPKPLIKIANRTVLEHNLEQLKGIVDEAIIVTGWKGDMIREKYGNSHNGIRIRYAEQKELLGTGHALLAAEGLIRDRFIIMPCDDLFSGEDMKRCVQHKYSVLAKEVDDPSRFGIFTVDGNIVAGIEEKPAHPESRLANTACWVMDRKLVGIMEKIPKSERGEYEITDALRELIKEEQVVCEIVKGYWLPLGYPWDLLDANSFFLAKTGKSVIKGKMGGNVNVSGNIIVGKGSEILDGTYIEGNVIIGENSKIGPNCYIRGNTSIGDNCRVGQAVEIKNSIIMDSAKVPHLSYVGDSVIGEGANLGAGTITANLRHDNGNVRSMANGKLTDTGRRKFGTAVGENVHTGINTVIYPGRKIWADRTTLPGEIVKKDVV